MSSCTSGAAIQFDAAQGMLRWDGGAPIAAEALVVEPGAALFRIR